MTGGQSQADRVLIDTYENYDAHWTPEYRAKIKAQADREWKEESDRYDALRNPFKAIGGAA